MAIPHAQPAELVDVRPMGNQLSASGTRTLIKTAAIEVIRLVLLAGREITAHQVPGELTLQCLEGRVIAQVDSAQVEMSGGELIYLRGSQEHSLRAIEDSSLLLTIVLSPKPDLPA
jgi:quercetin dioxygenase-like cupin family protein